MCVCVRAHAHACSVPRTLTSVFNDWERHLISFKLLPRPESLNLGFDFRRRVEIYFVQREALISRHFSPLLPEKFAAIYSSEKLFRVAAKSGRLNFFPPLLHHRGGKKFRHMHYSINWASVPCAACSPCVQLLKIGIKYLLLFSWVEFRGVPASGHSWILPTCSTK